MKTLIVCVLALVGLALAGVDLYSRPCAYINGKCADCPVNTRVYTTECGYLTPEATCEEPNPVADERGGPICDYVACYCEPGLVRHTPTNTCVKLEDCQKLNK